MFTGIVENLGKVVARQGPRFEVEWTGPTEEAWFVGESVAVDGCCLTVILAAPTDGGARLGFDLSEETYAKTALGDRRPGDRVNLERAMRLSDRLGGHLVQGHVDATGTVLEIEKHPDSWRYRYQAPPEFARYLAPKGSIAVDGISLTIVDPTEGGAFDVWIIPHTYEVTQICDRKPGDRVNLEFDAMAKMVERLVQAYLPGAGA
ncbi:MAG: riboflavin synthase [Fimbriimonadaceae bacterium]|nr:riboflavin synthase [Fimbriimonadaceae bacterium]